jgi:hypothetical protein
MPLARTEPDPGLFPAATGAGGPHSAAELRRHNVQQALAGRGGMIAAYALAQIGLPLTALATTGSAFPTLLIGGVLLLVPIVFFGLHAARAEKEFWRGYAAVRGLRHREGGRLHAECPLYARGDEQRFENLLAGRIGPCHAVLAHFVAIDISRDNKGHKRRSETPFTVVHCELPPAVAQRFRGVYLRERGFSLGKLQDFFAHDRAVNLASAEFDRLYSLRVVDEQDDIALFELFSTTFVDDLIRTVHVTFEQRDADLVVYCRGRCNTADELDGLCAAAAFVATRYLEEHR